MTISGNPFILCISSKERFSITFRGDQACFLGGAMIDGVVTPILLGSMNVEIHGRGFFHCAYEHEVCGSSFIILDLLGHQVVVDRVLTKYYASKIIGFHHIYLLFLFKYLVW